MNKKLGNGIKNDQNKIRMDLLSPYALIGTATVLTYGANKYEDRNWEKGLQFSRVFGALLRHLMAFWMGQDIDPETGLSHLDHASCCLMFLQHYKHNGSIYAKLDDRSINKEIVDTFLDNFLDNKRGFKNE